MVIWACATGTAPAKAKAALEKALALHADIGDDPKARALSQKIAVDLAHACLASGEEERAKDILSKVAAENPEDRGMIAQIQGVFAKTGNEEAGQSMLAQVGREELAHHGHLLADDGLLGAARAAIGWIARARSGMPIDDMAAATAARGRYNAAVLAVDVAARASAAPDLLLEVRQAVHQLLAGVQADRAGQAVAALDAYIDELEGARLRTAEMLAHALSAAQLQELAQRVRQARPELEVRTGELAQAEGVLAWSLLAAPAGCG